MDRGYCVWFTGLTGAGKSTLAAQLIGALAGSGRPTVLFDGDGDPGVERIERNDNVVRMATEAAKVVNDGGIAVCTLISPYDESRKEAREIVGADRFVLVSVCTPQGICEERDTKGLYDRARRQELRNFVGVEETYEAPRDADVYIDMSASIVGLQVLLNVLRRRRLAGTP